MTLVALHQPARLTVTHGSLYGHQPDQRPLVEVEVAATDAGGILLGKPVRTLVLVDSGADVTMLDGGLATTLGLDLSDPQYPKRDIGGVGAGGVAVTQMPVKMLLCERWISVPVDFTSEPMPHPQLLGRAGAFEAMLVAFMHGQTAMLLAAA